MVPLAAAALVAGLLAGPRRGSPREALTAVAGLALLLGNTAVLARVPRPAAEGAVLARRDSKGLASCTRALGHVGVPRGEKVCVCLQRARGKKVDGEGVESGSVGAACKG